MRGQYNRTGNTNAMRPPGFASWNYIFSRYRHGARIRGLVFEVTLEEFQELCSKNCFYCDAAPKRRNKYYRSDGTRNKCNPTATARAADRAWIVSNGVDRLDSSAGYTLNNCVPCCDVCNTMKSDMSVDTFLKHVGNISAKRKQVP